MDVNNSDTTTPQVNPEAFDILFEEVRTLAEAYQLDDELRNIEQQSFGGLPSKPSGKSSSVSLAEKVESTISSRTYHVLKELEAKGFINVNNPEQLSYFFQLAHKYIQQMPRLQLQIAVDLNEQMLTKVYAWVSRTVKNRVFLDIVVKPQILAGCAMVYRGVYRDFTLRTMLEEQSKAIFKPIIDDITKRMQPK